ncbi:MAG: ribulose-phosphate 3-epimerase [Anaerolineales bacterium]
MSPKTPVLAPSILSADFTRLGEQVAACQQAGADWIHVDVMDGHFVPNLTFGPLILQACRRVTDLPLDVHLMVEKPESMLEAFARAGASRLTVHVETCPHLHRTLEQIRELGVLPGVTLNPSTPASALKEILPLVDLVLVMSVNPGFGGQEFIEASLGKIAEIRQMLDEAGLAAWLEVDGGVSVETLPRLRAAGADAFVAGNSVFNHRNGIQAGVGALRKLLV